jgi:ribonuclease VapC
LILATSAVIAVLLREARQGELAEKLEAQDSVAIAALNILDCMTYATARIAVEPLLFTGNDFARTDIAAA